MQIQRLQNFYLLIALVLSVASLLMPWWHIDGVSVGVCADPVLLIVGAAAAVLSLLGICLFKNLQRQKLVCTLAFVLAAVAVIYGVSRYMLADERELMRMGIGAPPMAIAAVFAVMARMGVVRDQKLLRSADRLR